MFKIFKIFLHVPFARKVVVKIDLVRINVVEPFEKKIRAVETGACRNEKFLSNL